MCTHVPNFIGGRLTSHGVGCRTANSPSPLFTSPGLVLMIGAGWLSDIKQQHERTYVFALLTDVPDRSAACHTARDRCVFVAIPNKDCGLVAGHPPALRTAVCVLFACVRACVCVCVCVCVRMSAGARCLGRFCSCRGLPLGMAMGMGMGRRPLATTAH